MCFHFEGGQVSKINIYVSVLSVQAAKMECGLLTGQCEFFSQNTQNFSSIGTHKKTGTIIQKQDIYQIEEVRGSVMFGKNEETYANSFHVDI